MARVARRACLGTCLVTDQYGILHSGGSFLHKLCTPTLLLGKLRETLDDPSPFARPPASPRPALACAQVAAYAQLGYTERDSARWWGRGLTWH
jgi:hypothetical protein